jgi:hypothetical protein
MNMSTEQNAASGAENKNGFFINIGTLTGHFFTPAGHEYKVTLKSSEVRDPRTGELATLWGGYANAVDRHIEAKDADLRREFARTQQRPADLFPPEAKDIPLWITLRERPGKGFDLIGSFWNSEGRSTILARDLKGKNNLRFGGNVLPWKSAEALEAERAAKAENGDAKPNGEQARTGARKRAQKRAAPEPQAPAPDGGGNG